ncbi:protein kinase superfamily protein [Artemisia annua]|uniref:Protein kinase superfamily protein n=1 Tax=Artemisia annua TaxID=35608 RepID=A0A2U1Q9W3_ARTAN|nr:protein kinase superfamily protein [Artemisia annua]
MKWSSNEVPLNRRMLLSYKKLLVKFSVDQECHCGAVRHRQKLCVKPNRSSNVLLDQNFNAKLSDFGHAREGPQGDRTHVSTMALTLSPPCWDIWICCPEYVETGHLKSNSDLYSFGVVLYDILTGRKAIDKNLPHSEQKLLEWVKQFPADSKRFRVIMDPRLNNQYSLEAVRKIAKLADTCLRKNPDDKPAMSRIVDVFREAIRESENENNSQFGSPLPEPSARRMVHAA